MWRSEYSQCATSALEPWRKLAFKRQPQASDRVPIKADWVCACPSAMSLLMSMDRRVRKTRSALTDALMSLMTVRGYRRLPIDALLEHTKVARSTFYAHFR